MAKFAQGGFDQVPRTSCTNKIAQTELPKLIHPYKKTNIEFTGLINLAIFVSLKFPRPSCPYRGYNSNFQEKSYADLFALRPTKMVRRYTGAECASRAQSRVRKYEYLVLLLPPLSSESVSPVFTLIIIIINPNAAK